MEKARVFDRFSQEKYDESFGNFKTSLKHPV